jgi:phage RecT family recombinase
MGSDLVINPRTIHSELQKLVPQMDKALPRHLSAERMARIALTQLRVNPKLMQCTPESFFAAMMVASQVGLEPGINGQCYLIPYKTTCTFVPGWRGLMDLLSRTGRASAWTNAVYDGDEFDYEYGDKPFVHHKAGKWTGKEEAMRYTYAVGRQKEAEWPVIEVWDIAKIWDHRDKNNKSFNKTDHYSYKHPEMYARKIPLLQVIKYLPSSPELANASALDIAASEGKQRLTLDMALKGELETGGAVEEQELPADEEVDALFAKLNKNQTERDLLLKSYENNRDGLIKFLQSKLPVANVQTEKAKRTKPAEKKQEPAAEEKPAEEATPESAKEEPVKEIERVEVTEDMLKF